MAIYSNTLAWKISWKEEPDRLQFQFSSVQSLSCVQLFVTEWTAACQSSLSSINSQFSSVQFSCSVMSYSATAARQASLSITDSRSLLKLMFIKLLMTSNHLILCHPLFFPPSIFPASGSFLTSQFFASGGQSIGVAASISILPMNIQD